MLKQLSRSLGIRSSPIVANLIRSKQVCTRGFHISLVKQNTSSKVNEITDITSGSLKVKEDAAGSDLPSTKTDKNQNWNHSNLLNLKTLKERDTFMIV